MQTPIPLPTFSHQLPTEFVVVGEHVGDPFQLLLRDPDGNFYMYALPDGEPTLIEPGEDWAIERPADDGFFM